ncbi:MAG TPA: TIGR03435 family protein [Bryobacteraceae bacterium]|nr:TIGR03435 family protein [Bryobacteraceae bacterium]
MTPTRGIAGLAMLLSTATIAQVSRPQLQFEVASIKPSDPMGRGQFQIHPGGTLDLRAVTLNLMILWAYDIRDFQLAGGPAWTVTQRYDILAKSPKNESELETAPKTTAAEDGNSVTDSIRLRLQALLADRFHLKLRRDMKEMSAYALVVEKNGPKLKENDAELRGWMQWGRGHLKGTHVDMRFLCVHLSRQVDRTVVDETGLTGAYDFELNWVPDSGPARLPVGPGAQTPPPGEGGVTPAPPDGPSIFTAIQEQLGLKLELKKGPVAFFTIDHAEKPSDN